MYAIRSYYARRRKGPEVIAQNHALLDAGYAWGREAFPEPAMAELRVGRAADRLRLEIVHQVQGEVHDVHADVQQRAAASYNFV